jgi:multiple sugar transport system ATP-binding protein
VIEPTGSETMILGRIGEHSVTALVRGRPDVRPGAVIAVLPEQGHVHLFDAEGQRVPEPVVRLETGSARH